MEIMGKHVQDEIVNQINNLDTKYYSIIVESMPDLTHVDQLVIVVQYCYNGKPCEIFNIFTNRKPFIHDLVQQNTTSPGWT